MPNGPRLSSSGKGEAEQDTFRVRPGRNAAQDRGGSGGAGSGWARGWGRSGGGVKAPPAHRTAYTGRSAGKVASASMSSSQQRAVVKMSYHKMTHAGAHAKYLEREGAGLEQSTAHAHSEYLTREGGGLEHERGQALDLHSGKPIDAAARVERWGREHDAYHWRGIIAGEHTPESMTAMVQEMVGKAEIHLGTRLDGFMVHHHGQGNPHTHVVFRGRHENGKALYIAPSYIQNGFRDSVQQYLTREFGERSDLEIQRGQDRSFEIRQEREQGLERVREYAQERGLDEKDRLALEHTMRRGSAREIEQTHRRLDTLERVHEVSRELEPERQQEMERKAIDGTTRQVAQVERQVQQVEQRVERVRERSRDYGMER
jgi:type IV secretory pathway VirD2 relaxase